MARWVKRPSNQATPSWSIALGDTKFVGEGVFEMREHFGCGWRMYYVQRGDVLLVMLGGGDKSTQDNDIEKAQKLASTLE